MKWPLSVVKRLWWAKLTLGVGIALIVYALVGYFLLPTIIQWQMLKRLPAITHCTLSVQQVKLNPFVLSLTIRGFVLKETNGDVFCSFDELYANLQLVSIFKRVFVFKEIRLKKPFRSVTLQQDGKFYSTDLLSASPHVVVERLSVTDGVLAVEDSNPTQALKLSRINLTLEGLSNKTNAPVSVTLSMLCNETGTVSLQGTVFPFARTADIQVQATDLDLRAIQPYVAEIWKLEITGGALTATGRVLVAAAGPTAPLVQFAGMLRVANFSSVDSEAREEFLKLDSLTLTGLDLRYLPHGLDIASVNVAGLRGNMIILPDKSSNWKGIVKNAERLHELVVKLQLNKLFPFQISTVTFEDGAFRFADRSIKPNVAADLQGVTGSVNGLSSAASGTMNVDLHGMVDGESPLTISGTINPLADDLKLDLTLSLKNGEMPPGSPYAAKYVGRPIYQGQLSIEAHYVVNHRLLKAENKFRAHQLRLGAKNSSPDATQLRIKLAIALLQDRDGIVPFDMSINGNLDDPQFKFGSVIAEIFRSLITKAVSNPFALLGALVGGDEQLSFVNFEPGSADFVAGETRKLDALAKALDARPALELAITGSVNTTNDRIALATIKLHEFKARWITGAVPEQPVVTTATPDATPPTQNFGPSAPSDGEAKPLPRFSLPVAEAYAKFRFTDTEATIIEAIEVTPDDFRALMQARAEKVEQYLRQTGHVAPDRLFIVTPKPVDSSFQGQCRVDLSLQ